MTYSKRKTFVTRIPLIIFYSLLLVVVSESSSSPTTGAGNNNTIKITSSSSLEQEKDNTDDANKSNPISTSPSSSLSKPDIDSNSNNISNTSSNNNNKMMKQKRFTITGPILTVTLKDPFFHPTSTHYRQQQATTTNSDSYDDDNTIDRDTDTHSNNINDDNHNSSSMIRNLASSNNNPNHNASTNNNNPPSLFQRGKNILSRTSSSIQSHHHHLHPSNFFGLDSLSPTILWSIRSITKPLPNYIPFLSSATFTTAYQYTDLKNKPSFMEGNVLLRLSERWDVDLDVASTYEVKKKKLGCHVKIGARGDWMSAVASFTNKGQKILEQIRFSYKTKLPPFFSDIDSISISPTYDFRTTYLSCLMIGKSTSGRTAAIVDLNWDKPSLSVHHALDERNTISPEICLSNAKITYNWNLLLPNSSGYVKTRVDPTDSIQISWMDVSRNGKWVTDFKLPLVMDGSTMGGGVGNGVGGVKKSSGGVGGGGWPHPLAGNIRVRRQFVF